MSEVKRYQFKWAAGEYVYANDFDRVTAERDALQALLTAADERVDVLERDKARIDWLAEQPVDTLYLDDGRIIDIAGRVDLRDAIDAAMAALKPADDVFVDPLKGCDVCGVNCKRTDKAEGGGDE